jgi:hypothetical protein
MMKHMRRERSKKRQALLRVARWKILSADLGGSAEKRTMSQTQRPGGKRMSDDCKNKG